jgi:hypothetical protein
MSPEEALEAFAQRHHLTIVRPFTSLGGFDAILALLVDADLLMSISYDRGSASINLAATLAPSFWMSDLEIIRLMGVAQEPQPNAPQEPRPKIDWKTLEIPTDGEAIEEAFGRVDPAMAYVRDRFKSVRTNGLFRELGKLRRPPIPPGTSRCPVCGKG